MQYKQNRETRKFLCTPVAQVETTDKTFHIWHNLILLKNFYNFSNWYGHNDLNKQSTNNTWCKVNLCVTRRNEENLYFLLQQPCFCCEQISLVNEQSKHLTCLLSVCVRLLIFKKRQQSFNFCISNELIYFKL